MRDDVPRCAVCRWPSPVSPCGGCAEQARRLRVSPEMLASMAQRQVNHTDGGWGFLKRAYAVGLLERPVGVKPQLATPNERKAKALEMHAKGIARGMIANLLGVRVRSVNRWLA